MKSLTVYTDASVDYNSKQAGIGFCISQHGSEIHTKSEQIPYCEPVKAEWIALINALKTVQTKYNANTVQIHTDCHSIATIIDGVGEPNSDMSKKMYALFNKIEKSFSHVQVSYVERENNTRADTLARTSY